MRFHWSLGLVLIFLSLPMSAHAAKKAVPEFDWDTLETTSGFQMPSNYPASEQEAYLSGSIYNDWFDSGCELPGSPYNGELGFNLKNHHTESYGEYDGRERSRCLNKDGRLEEMYFGVSYKSWPGHTPFGWFDHHRGFTAHRKFYHYYQPTPNSGTMKGSVTPTDHGSAFNPISTDPELLTRAPQLARNLRGGLEAHLEMFYIDGGNFPFSLMNRFQDPKAASGWTAPSLMPLSEGVRDFAVFRNQKGAIEVLALVTARRYRPGSGLMHYYQVLDDQGQFVKWANEDWGTMGGRLMAFDKAGHLMRSKIFISWGRTPHGDFVLSIPRAPQSTKGDFQQSFQLVQTYTPSKGWYWFIDDNSMNWAPLELRFELTRIWLLFEHD